MKRRLPAVDLLEAEVLKRDLDALRWLAEERVLAVSIWRIVLRVVGREKPARDARPGAVEVVGALRTPASTASYNLELTCVIIIVIIVVIIILSLSLHKLHTVS